MNDLIMIIIAMFILLGIVVGLMIYLKRIKKGSVVIREKRDVEEEAYNQMQMVRNMARLMRDKGYDTSSVDSMLRKAMVAYDSSRYVECIEIANNAKRILLRMRDEQRVEDGLSPQVARELEIMKRIEMSAPKKEEMPPQVKDFIKKLPENYLQSKFEIKVVEDKLLKAEKGKIWEVAALYLQKAKDAFFREDYTEALRLAIKSGKILDTGEIPTDSNKIQTRKIIGDVESKELAIIPHKEEDIEPVEEEGLRCPECNAVVREEDKFCWNCGAKLVFIFECPNCGAEVSSEDRFCRQCGHRLR